MHTLDKITNTYKPCELGTGEVRREYELEYELELKYELWRGCSTTDKVLLVGK